MTRSIRVASACGFAMLSLSACATTGQLKEERRVRFEADSAQQGELAAHRDALTSQKQELLAQREQIAALRTDFAALRTEFGAKIAEVAEGLQFVMPIHFSYDDAAVRTADAAALERFSKVVKKHYGGAKVTVEGFADPAGSAAYNMALSQRRAEAVRDFIGERGIDPSLVTAVGYGKTRLVNPTASRDAPGAELNRRVVFVIETPPNAVTTMALSGQ